MYYKLYKPGYIEKILLTECGRIVTSNSKKMAYFCSRYKKNKLTNKHTASNVWYLFLLFFKRI